MLRFLSLTLALLSFSLPLQAQTRDKPAQPPAPAWLKHVDLGKQDPRLKGYLAAEGLKAEIVAESPVVKWPVAATFGFDGTLYILEESPGPEIMRGIFRPGHFFRLSALLQSQGSEQYDKAREIESIWNPSRWKWGGGGFGGGGNFGSRKAVASRPEGDERTRELPYDLWGRVKEAGNPIAQHGPWLLEHVVLSQQLVKRQLSGKGEHLFASGFGNVGGLACTSQGEVFLADSLLSNGSVDPDLRVLIAILQVPAPGLRVLHVPEGSDFGLRKPRQSRSCVPADVRQRFQPVAATPPVLRQEQGAATGCLIYEDAQFPDHFRGLLLVANGPGHRVHAYRVEPEESTYKVVEGFDLLKTAESRFQPAGMTVGPDGAIYLCDVGGPESKGRIIRLSWAGTEEFPAIPRRPMTSWQEISKLAEPELVKALGNAAFSDRQVAQRTLIRKGDSARATLLKMMQEELGDKPTVEPRSLPWRVAAFGVLESLWNEQVRELSLKLLEDGEPTLRRLAAEALGHHCPKGDAATHAALLQVLGDPDPMVRRAVALAMGRIAAPGAGECLVNALRFDEGRDAVLRSGLIRAIELSGKQGIDQLNNLAMSGIAEERDRAIAAFVNLHGREAAVALPELLKNPHLQPKQVAAVLAAFDHFVLDPPISLDPVLDYLMDHPQADVTVKLVGLDVLSRNDALKGDRARGLLQRLAGEADPDLKRAAQEGLKQFPN